MCFLHESLPLPYYSTQLKTQRPNELLIKREATFECYGLRADLRTVDDKDVLREWEFKLTGDYSSLGQILTYTALLREQLKFKRVVRGVIAAFEIPEFLVKAVQINNLSIELVILPKWMALAGNIPLPAQEAPSIELPLIPRANGATDPTC